MTEVALLEMSDGSRIETVQWGAGKEPLFFLAGLTRTAWCFTHLVRHFQENYQCVGITRRGYGDSFAANTDFFHDRLVADILEVMDQLGVPSAHFVAHSFGVQEARLLAETEAARIKSLTILDGYDTSEDLAILTERRPPGPPEPGPADLNSASAYQAYFEKVQGGVMPIEEITASFALSGEGQLMHEKHEPGTTIAIMRRCIPQDWQVFNMPVMAMFLGAETAEEYAPGIRFLDAVNQDRLADFISFALERKHRQIDDFKRAVPHAEVTRLPGSSHNFYLARETETAACINQFLAGLLNSASS